MKNVGTTTSSFPSSVTTGDPGIDAGAHTPTPWIESFSDKTGWHTFYGVRGDGNNRKSDGRGILFYLDATSSEDADLVQFPRTDPEMNANAAFILRACNSHDDLVKALEEIVAKFDACTDPVVHNTPLGINNARAALAKAKA